MRLFWRQLTGEFRKLFARKRTFIGFGAFVVFELVVLFLLNLPKVEGALKSTIEKSGYDSATYLSGLTLALLIVAWTIFLLGALYLALVGGDVVSKEIEDGSLRMMLCRPVSRGRIIFLKIVVSCFYTFVLTVFVMLTALLAGILDRGIGGMFIVDPINGLFVFHDAYQGLWRYALAIPLLSLSLCTVTALAFCLSCFNMKPSAATVITLSFLFADTILKNIPFFDSIKGFFFTTKMAAWIHIFEYRVPWEWMAENYAWLIALDATLFIIGWQVFERRDFKS